jgi:alpha-beta hydrolase superfamily lysophospholipase
LLEEIQGENEPTLTEQSTSDPENEDLPKGMQRIVYSLPVDYSGATVYLKGWCVKDSSRPPLLIVHDLGEHIGLYEEFAMKMVAKNYSVYGFDLRGHGRSGRRLGHAPSFEVLTHDLLQVAAWIRHKQQGMVPIILGQGIGSLVAMDFGRKKPDMCLGIILSAPCVELKHKPSAASRFFLWSSSDLIPTARIPNRLAPRFARELNSARKKVHSEPRDLFPGISMRFAHELLKAIDKFNDDFIQYGGPILILCPEEDAICSFTRIRKSAATHDKHNLVIHDIAGGHGLYYEKESMDAVVKCLVPWLSQPFPVQSPANCEEAVISNPTSKIEVQETSGPDA